MAKNQNYEVVDHKPEGGGLIKMWTKGVSVEDSARQQLKNMSMLPFVHSHIAVMPDVHLGKGATVGSVIPTKNAIVPASVGVDLGCGMCAVRTSLTSHDLPHNLKPLRGLIEKAVPHGRTSGGSNDKGSWKGNPPNSVLSEWRKLEKNFKPICDKYKHLEKKNHLAHLGTLGTGNHFVEICLDREDRVWVMLHSGSRGIGNAIGMTFIEKAKKEMEKWHIHLPDRDLSYLPEGSEYFNDYWEALKWAQDFARVNREIMLSRILDTMRRYKDIPGFTTDKKAINCFAGETRVITKFGTKEIKDLVNQEHELLTSLGQWVKAPIKSFGKQKLLKLTVSRCGRFKDIYTTEEHRWIVDPVQRQYTVEKTTKDLEPGDRLSSNFPKHQEKLGEIPAEAIARGFVFGNGSQTSTNRSCANFCGNKDKTILSLFQENNIGLEARKYKNLTRINGLPSEWKNELPSLHENNEYLYGWLAGYFAADGDVDKTGRPTLSSAKIENLRFVRNLATKIGVGTFGIRSRIRSGFGGRESPLHQLGIMRNDLLESFFLISHHRKRFNNCNVYERRHWKVESVKETDRFEEVYCAVVENTHCFTLEDNILTRNCHHNYVDKENHFGHNVYVTRKGAIRAREGDLGIIPGSMGAKSFIVEGKGNPDSFCSCSHGAGRKMSRTQAKDTFSLDDHIEATKGVECRKDDAVIDETPMAYKDIEAVMEAQRDLVEVKHVLKQILCVKG